MLLPGALLPLHVFEQRYRDLVAHCRDGWELMGIATLRPGYEDDYEGRPAVWPEIGIGRIVAYQPLPDGRSNILLRFVARARLVEELDSEHAFREVRVEILQDRPPADGSVYAEVRGLVQAIGSLSDSAREEAGRLLELEGAELVDALARKLLRTPDEQRRYLAEDQIQTRGELMIGALGEVLAGATPGAAEA